MIQIGFGQHQENGRSLIVVRATKKSKIDEKIPTLSIQGNAKSHWQLSRPFSRVEEVAVCSCLWYDLQAALLQLHLSTTQNQV